MKTLSILILVGTITALIIGGIFAVTPVLAENKPAVVALEPNSTADIVAPVAPVTGNLAAVEPVVVAPVAVIAADEPGTVLASTFTVGLAKDFDAQAAQQEAEAQQVATQAESALSLDNFIASVSNGNAKQVTGIYVDGLMAYSVVRQPGANAAYVSEAANEVTAFGLAAQYGSQAFLAHNYLAGASFSELSIGQIVTLVYGDGSSARFSIDGIQRYQALSPDSTQSRFVNLDTGEEISASTLFHTVYNNDNALVLQTCINQDGISTWGRLFVEATQISD